MDRSLIPTSDQVPSTRESSFTPFVSDSWDRKTAASFCEQVRRARELE